MMKAYKCFQLYAEVIASGVYSRSVRAFVRARACACAYVCVWGGGDGEGGLGFLAFGEKKFREKTCCATT